MSQPVENNIIKEALDELEGWGYDGSSIHKTYEFGSFREAMGFIVRIGFEAEALNHHPHLENVFNRVTIKLSTHDAGDQVTQLDLNLAKVIEEIDWTRS